MLSLFFTDLFVNYLELLSNKILISRRFFHSIVITFKITNFPRIVYFLIHLMFNVL